MPGSAARCPKSPHASFCNAASSGKARMEWIAMSTKPKSTMFCLCVSILEEETSCLPTDSSKQHRKKQNSCCWWYRPKCILICLDTCLYLCACPCSAFACLVVSCGVHWYLVLSCWVFPFHVMCLYTLLPRLHSVCTSLFALVWFSLFPVCSVCVPLCFLSFFLCQSKIA